MVASPPLQTKITAVIGNFTGWSSPRKTLCASEVCASACSRRASDASVSDGCSRSCTGGCRLGLDAPSQPRTLRSAQHNLYRRRRHSRCQRLEDHSLLVAGGMSMMTSSRPPSVKMRTGMPRYFAPRARPYPLRCVNRPNGTRSPVSRPQPLLIVTNVAEVPYPWLLSLRACANVPWESAARCRKMYVTCTKPA